MAHLVLLVIPTTLAQVSPIEAVLDQELARAMATFEQRGEPPYYTALSIEENQKTRIVATAGTLQSHNDQHVAFLDVDLRLGSPDLDSTHPLRGMSSLREEARRTVNLPIEHDPDYPLRHAVWKELDAHWRDAVERIVVVRANKNVKVEEELPAPDFELREPTVDRQEVSFETVDDAAWTEILIRVSDRLDAHPRVHRSRAALTIENERETFVDTEGTRLVHGGTWARVGVSASATADDGDELSISRSMSFRAVDGLPSEQELLDLAEQARDLLVAQLDAPRGQPYRGPVLLGGKAAAVFFHEVLGHRVEGHRMKFDSDGKTFLEYVGRPILPPFLDIYDDPTIRSLSGEDLNGFYAYDDEGVPAQRALVVDDGVLRGFLMSRSPLPDFPHTNGHGRRSTGKAPSSRMGNTIVEASETVSHDKLRAMLLDKVRDQGLEYGLYVEEIAGGFTMTGRIMPNSFNVRAVTTYKVWADGRPDELIRGVDLVGTPLVAFGNIVAAGDDPGVFNGTCGAGSGWVPVSAISPSLLVEQVEFQLKEKGADRPPMLPKPDAPPPGAQAAGGER